MINFYLIVGVVVFGENRNPDSMEMLRRFQSEPVLANPRLESGNFKIKSDLRQSILYRHKQLTPMSDKRHPIRSSNPAHKQPLAGEIFTRVL